MNTLVTGIFEGAQQAAQAVRKLVKSCVPTDFVRTIHSGASKGQPSYRSNRDASGHPRFVKVAVQAPEYVAQQLAIKILRDYGAQDIECVNAERRRKSRVRVSLRKQHVTAPAS